MAEKETMKKKDILTFSDADQLMATIEVICGLLNGSMVQWPYFHHHQNCTG